MPWSILSLLFPARCIGCGKNGSVLCRSCIAALPPADDPQNADIFAAFDYGNRVAERAIRDMKYHRRSEAAAMLMHAAAPDISLWLSERLGAFQTEKIALVPIPQHRRKRGIRGFNQSELLARELAKALPGSKVVGMLEKHRFTVPQARTKNKRERLENVAGSMRAARPLAEPLSLYLLIDDVTTTGATFAEARRALRAAGATKILSIALAHGYARRKK